jgi:hypothetical protein
MKNASTALAIAAVTAVMSGCATQGSSPSAETSASPGQAPTPSAIAPAAVREVPALKVGSDCGGCQVRSTVPGLIVVGYNNAAAKAGMKVAQGAEASVLIKEYAARDDTARFLAGAFAGKDEIKAAVSHGGKEFVVEDYYRNAWLGIQDLARKIGEMIFERLKPQ